MNKSSPEALDNRLEELQNSNPKIVNKFIEDVKKRTFVTSTPLNQSMDVSLQIDSDSGYVSHNQESNSEIPQESTEGNISKALFINEDALLEKPESVKKQKITEEVYEEFSHLYYLNNSTSSSIVNESECSMKSNFSILKGSDSSEIEQEGISPDINVLKEIVLNTNNIAASISNSGPSRVSNNLEASKLCSPSKLLLQKLSGTPRKELTICDANLLMMNFVEPCCSKSIKNSPNKAKRKRSFSRSPRKQYTPKKPIVSKPTQSPDLFSDDECVVVNAAKPEPTVAQEKYTTRCDRETLKRVTKTLSGVLPPPSLTTTYITVDNMLEKIHANQELFCNKDDATMQGLNDCLDTTWPAILEKRHHGLHYNRSKVSEEIESMYMKYSQRYIGAETQSSCTVFEMNFASPSKRRACKLRRAEKSPAARRLSHLARRRITFSSLNLQGNMPTRRILIDSKRFELLSRRPSPRKGRSPRKTPRKSPRKMVKTPSSSVKKRLAFRVYDDVDPGPSTSSSSSSQSALRASATKRALFQSPDKSLQRTARITPSTSNPSLSPWKKRNTPKRALFNSPQKNEETHKRKRLDSDDDPPRKLQRCLSEHIETTTNPRPLLRFKSESLLQKPVELSANHKKKLQWAVYEALRGRNIGVTHPEFKQFASVLARVIRRLLPTVVAPKSEIGTSERMLRIANKYVQAVKEGKSVDEIIQIYETNRLKALKPSGYVSKDMDVSMARTKDTAFQDKVNTLNNAESGTKTNNKPPENKADRVRKIINFDDSSSLSAFK